MRYDDYTILSKEFIHKIITDTDIPAGKAKLLFWFMAQEQVGRADVIIATINMMSNDLGCSKIAVYRWLSCLIEKGYISRHKTPDGKVLHNTYIVNPEYINKGKLVIDKDEVQ